MHTVYESSHENPSRWENSIPLWSGAVAGALHKAVPVFRYFPAGFSSVRENLGSSPILPNITSEHLGPFYCPMFNENPKRLRARFWFVGVFRGGVILTSTRTEKGSCCCCCTLTSPIAIKCNCINAMFNHPRGSHSNLQNSWLT